MLTCCFAGNGSPRLRSRLLIRLAGGDNVTSELLPVHWHGQRAVVTLPEEMDISNGAIVQDKLISVLGQHPAVLIADMSATAYCDSAGVRAIMLTYRQAAASGCELRLVIGTPGVSRVFSLLGVEQLIQIHPHLGSALGESAGDSEGPPEAGSGT